jgi:hypothetical protein
MLEEPMRRDRDPDQPPKANALEILGAWLRVWTPPRDVEIPPVPRRAAAALGGGLIVVVALVLLVVSPAVDTGKREDADRRAREAAAAKARRNAIVRRDQRARTGSDPELAPASTPSERRALVADVERAITADANQRFADGTVTSRTRSTTCDPFLGGPRAEDDPSRRRAAYDCTALIREIVGQGDPGRLGYPFRAIVDFERGSWAFCKVNPIPSERSLPDPRTIVPLPAACRAPTD